jgi:hypothetical protein
VSLNDLIRTWVVPAVVVAGLTVMTMPTDPGASAPTESPDRLADQTFLTFPEWYLVHSPEEYATFLTHSPPDEFPFMGHVGQFWSSYGSITDYLSAEGYPFNGGYHLMVNVIGLSTTAEYAIRTGYELAVGRLSKLIASGEMTDEDRYAAGAARRYVDFINHTPFYKYPFADDLTGLWRETSQGGEGNLLRRWERKYALTTEYGVKAGYAWFIGKLTAGTYAKPLLTTTVRLKGAPPAPGADLPKLELLSQAEGEGQTTLINLPRYAEFTSHALALARRGRDFVAIAGNEGDILTSVLVPAGMEVSDTAARKVLFVQPLLTQPTVKRLGLVCKVADLRRLLMEFAESPYVIEHIYDF